MEEILGLMGRLVELGRYRRRSSYFKFLALRPEINGKGINVLSFTITYTEHSGGRVNIDLRTGKQQVQCTNE